MQRILIVLFFIASSFNSFSQANYVIADHEKDYKKAKEYFIQGNYALAYPILKPLIDKYPENTTSSHAYLNQDIEYYYIVCGLKLNQPVAEESAKLFVDAANNEPRQQMMSFHLARYYFTRNDFARAIVYYERAGYDNLSNDEIADAKFELAYSYFNTADYEKAKPLFNEIHQLPSNKYYNDANYYYGYLSYQDKDFAEALSSFKKIENVEKFKNVAPYYLAQILYFNGDHDKALNYAETALSQPNTSFSKELKLLTGQIYFEKKQFAKALPLLEGYVNSSDKVSKEVMYELSYCYYNANQVEKAIAGFKQLSNEKDSLGQNSMYLLGDLYLRTNQKANARTAFKYSADNNSNRFQQEVSRFNYAKLSYELGYNDVALASINNFLDLYPTSAYSNEAKEILINLLTNSNNYAEALRLFESYGKPTPTMQRILPKILFGRAIEYLDGQQLNEADNLLSKIIKDPNAGTVLPFAYFWKGEIAYRQSRYEDAAKNISSYLQDGGIQGEASPTNAHYVLGYSYLKLQNYAKAAENFKEVASAISATSSAIQQDAFVRTADAYFMQKSYGQAKSLYQKVIDLSLPQSDYALYQQALINGINNTTEKIKTFNALVQRYPNSDLVPEANMQIANSYMLQERFRDAIPVLNKIINDKKATALYPKAYLKIGLSYYNMNNNAEALKNYQQLVNLYPASDEASEAMENVRNIYIEMGKADEYVTFAKKAGVNVSVSETDSLTYTAAELKYSGGDCSAGIEAFKNYLSKFPTGSYAINAQFYMSECYSKNKDWQNAVKGYEAVVEKGSSAFAERAALAAARIYYIELQDYQKSKTLFTKLLQVSTTPENQLEALRGLTRSYYQTKDFAQANAAAKELLTKKGISTDDKAIANLVLGKSLQANNQCGDAMDAFKQVIALNKGVWAAEARYEIAHCYYIMNQLSASEKAALEVIKIAGADYWVARSYILLGDIYVMQKDYFNAKATYQSVALNATIPELKKEAQDKLDKTLADEQANSKVESPQKK